MTVKMRSSRTPRRKAPVLSITPPTDKPLNAECSEVSRKLRKALKTTQSGTTVGALIIALDETGAWSVDLAGRLDRDRDTLCVIACRVLGECLTHGRV